MTTEEYYTTLLEKCKDISSESFKGSRLALQKDSHDFLNDLGSWAKVLENRREFKIFKAAFREYQHSLLCVNLGLYNSAFMGLRFFLERSLVAIIMSAKEIELRTWEIGDRDTYWSEIVDDNNGIFSMKFSKAFFIELSDETKHFKAIAEKVYRECSEFVHGNISTLGKTPHTLEFDEKLYHEWHNRARTIKRLIIFVFCLRYLKELNSEEKKVVEASIHNEFSHLEVIRNTITIS